MALVENPRAVPGGNNPPEPTPFERVAEQVELIMSEAAHLLDGTAVNSQDGADYADRVLDELREAGKAVEAAHKVEKEPHLRAGREVDERYRPLREQVKRAVDGCKAALAPWRQEQERIKREAAEKAAAEAEAKRRAAEEAMRAAKANDLAERERAEALLKEAKKAEGAAKRADKAATSGTGLRTTHRAVLVDALAAGRHYWQARPDDFRDLIQRLADADVRNGKREIPGFEIKEEKVAI